MIFRKYTLEVKHKREGTGDYREIMVQFTPPPDTKTPYWLAMDPVGAPNLIIVTPDEFDSIEVGNPVNVNITIGEC